MSAVLLTAPAVLVFLSCVYRQSAYLLDRGNRQFKKKNRAPARKIIIMSTNADRVEFHQLFLRLAGPLKRGAFVEQCDCVFDFNFLTIFGSM